MKRVIAVGLAMLISIVFLSGSSYAQQSKDFFGGTVVGVYTHEMWRGMKLSKRTVVQPYIYATYHNFTGKVWANYDSHTSKFNQTDFVFLYSRSFNKLTLTPGYVYYSFTGANDTQEFFLSMAYDMFLQPNFTWYYDFKEGDGSYLNLTIGHTFTLPHNYAIHVGAQAGYLWDNKNMGTERDGGDLSDLYNGEVYMTASIPIWKEISLEPKIAYSFPLSDEAQRVFENIIDAYDFGGDSFVYYGGLAFRVNF
ncbi:MAG: hypothetical protein L3V56_04610 [Candidatus Magnetoovum sp. WYHC-5]|nr:hypothetical protein [Candidatus Magnetoovum sp. WYHC-5]